MTIENIIRRMIAFNAADLVVTHENCGKFGGKSFRLTVSKTETIAVEKDVVSMIESLHTSGDTSSSFIAEYSPHPGAEEQKYHVEIREV